MSNMSHEEWTDELHVQLDEGRYSGRPGGNKPLVIVVLDGNNAIVHELTDVRDDGETIVAAVSKAS